MWIGERSDGLQGREGFVRREEVNEPKMSREIS